MSFFKRRHPDDLEDEDYDANVDPDLRLRTVRSASATIAESIRSEQRAERRKSLRHKRSFFKGRRPGSSGKEKQQEQQEQAKLSTQVVGERRNVYVNTPLTAVEVDKAGEPIVRYPRNKVRTTKYTIITFIPKNLYEQFRRVANLYFLVTVILSVFPVFGATAPQTAMLPLVFILCITAIKDAIEDYRRATLDEEVNTSASTKLGNWRNVNQPTDSRTWFEKLMRLNQPGRVTKGVRRLREREANEGMRIILSRGDGDRISMSHGDIVSNSSSSFDGPYGAGGRRLEDIQSVDEHSYPPEPSQASLVGGIQQAMNGTPYSGAGSGSFSASNTLAPHASGVINWQKRITGSARWERTLWKKLEVGDIVLLKDDEQVPADIVVLSTSDPDGMCYLETKNLDGETNLKPRKSCLATTQITSEEDVDRSAFILDSEPPHPNLYSYNGVLRYIDPFTGEKKQESVTINEMLLRGCSIRNTAWIIGLVVFTGSDTKIMLNGGATPSKRSKIEKETNFNVIANFVILIAMCLVTAIVNGVFDSRSGTSASVFEDGAEPSSSPVLNALVTFASSLIAFQNIVPISLYISIEIVKTIQAFFISQDLDMYYKPFDTTCIPKTWNISDDLGQIEYIFSDKTGTLTQNVMEFQKCSIHGVSYGESITEAQRGAARREGRTDLLDADEHARKMSQMKSEMLQTMSRSFKNRYIQPDKLTIIAPQLAEDMADRTSEQRGHITAFFRALAVCHTVLAARPEPNKKPFLLEYKAESPDESALVAAARDVGFPFVNKTKEYIEIEVMGQAERYVPLKVLEFNSTRKRMSVIARTPQGKIILYCKGADSVIYERLADDGDTKLKAKTTKDMEMYANGGLRTLCIAYRYLTEDEYLQWSRTYDAATSAVENRDEEIDKANALVEHSLYILGATALEDKLQDGVPDAIETLHKAGIKLWVLTGDKVQTAIEIAFSCNLLKTDMDVMILSAETVDAARTQIEAGLNKIASVLGPPSWDPRKRGFLPNAKASFAVVIDGDTLRHALSPELKTLFLNLGTQCETVVCCRVSPAQKALTVKLVKEGRNAMTLSIGDGANDVAMIQEANIGCGLFGHEGSQAAMSADYAFGQFRFLTRLLLVHGRWSYRRIADMHSNFFYKNVIWTFAMFWFLPWNSFDATYLYEYTFILLYNLAFTSLPVIALGAFDQDINAKAAMAFPELYIRGIRGLEYTRSKFWSYMLDGLYQSVVVYFIPYLVWTIGSALSWDGKGIDSLSDFGTTVSVAAIFAANIFVGLNTHYWTVITWVVVVGSSLFMVLWIVIYSFFPTYDFNDEAIILFGNIIFWATVILSVALALAPRFLIKFVSSTYAPSDSDIVREMWVKGDLKDRLGIKHRRDRAGSGGLEAAPMFSKPHIRSPSEISSYLEGYQPALTISPTEDGSPSGGEKYTDISVVNSPSIESTGGHLHHGVTSDDILREDEVYLSPDPPSQHHLSPRQLAVSVSPRPVSYYSASDIPLPSPVPTAVYRHPSEAYSTSSTKPGMTSSPPPPPNSYEMRVRSPPRMSPHSLSPQPQSPFAEDTTVHGRPPETGIPQSSGMATTSYVNAHSAGDGAMQDHQLSERYQQDPGDDWRGSTYSYAGPRAL